MSDRTASSSSYPQSDDELGDLLYAAVKIGEPHQGLVDELRRRGHAVAILGSNVFIDSTFEGIDDQEVNAGDQ